MKKRARRNVEPRRPLRKKAGRNPEPKTTMARKSSRKTEPNKPVEKKPELPKNGWFCQECGGQVESGFSDHTNAHKRTYIENCRKEKRPVVYPLKPVQFIEYNDGVQTRNRKVL